MGLRDVLFGKKKLAEPKDDRLFALTTAAVTLDTELGLKTAGVAAIAFKPLSSASSEARTTTSIAGHDGRPRRRARRSSARPTSTASTG